MTSFIRISIWKSRILILEKELFKYQNTALDAGFDTLYSYTEYGYDEDDY